MASGLDYISTYYSLPFQEKKVRFLRTFLFFFSKHCNTFTIINLFIFFLDFQIVQKLDKIKQEKPKYFKNFKNHNVFKVKLAKNTFYS